MPDSGKITFDAFTLDPANELLWKGSDRIRLRPKTFAILRLLVERPGQLITKNELLNAVWRDCHVGDEALKHCVAEIRRALWDEAETPRLVETVHRRGYRFIGKIGAQPRAQASKDAFEGSASDELPLVGRASELAQLHHSLVEAMEGTRQLVFIAGDEGIGKTCLMDTFLSTVNPKWPSRPDGDAGADCLIARGQCIKSHGAGEAFMPIMEAFTGLCASHQRKRILALLFRYAPLWLSQMPSLVSVARWQTLQRTTQGATRERMMREIAEALEALAASASIILVLEDLHWSDYSTLDLISYLAQRRSPARLMIIASYRPAETSTDHHPLRTIKQQLQQHRQCKELRLDSLNESAVQEYLEKHYSGHGFSKKTAAWIKQRTGGNPLFIINLLEHLIARGLLVQHEGHWALNESLKDAVQTVPPTIQQIIERQMDRCTPQEQNLLKVASVQGVEFSAAGIASALCEKTDKVDAIIQTLVGSNQLLQSTGDSGKQTYRFIHTLYQDICYQRLSEDLRAQYHRRIAEYIEKANRKDPGEFAVRLAMHFDRGQEPRHALKYYQRAAENANSRYAGREALDLAARGMQLLSALPEWPDRKECEAHLQNALGTALMSVQGLGSEEAKQAFSRARDLFQKSSKRRQSGNRALLFSSLYGLWCYYWAHAEYSAARTMGEQLLELAKAEHNSLMLNQAHYSLGSILMDHGEFSGAFDHLEKSANVLSRCIAAVAKWHLGFPDLAICSIEETLAYALETGNLENCIFANLCTARLHMARREKEKTLERAQLALDLAIDNGLVEQWLAPMRSIRAWALAKLGQQQNGLEQMRQALSVFRGIGASNLSPLVLGMFAELSMDAGHFKEGLAAIEEGLTVSGSTGMNHCDAELYRLKGELLFRQISQDTAADPDDTRFVNAGNSIKKAVSIARRQQAKSLELRAEISLARLLMAQNRPTEARRRLQRIYQWFNEGFNTLDLKEAHALLRKLS
jgi:DNA-binding winged helix-turn-helix (wHTH) protein